MAGVTFNEMTFENSRGQRLFAIEVLPPEAEAKCVLVWAHGHAEHCRRKLEAFKAWAARGIAVFSFDAHGCGASEPLAESERGLVTNMSHLVDDMADYSAFLGRKHKVLDALPWFAGGYSVGGLVAALTVMRWQEEWAGLVLFAPAVGVNLTCLVHIQRFFGPCLDFTVPRARISQPLHAADLNPDPDAIAAYEADPLCTSGRTRARTAFQYSKGMDALGLMAPRITLPLYCEHHQGDTVARWEVSREFCACVGSEDVAWVAPEGGCHDELSGKRAVKIANRIADWILKKAAENQASGAARKSSGGGAVAAAVAAAAAAAGRGEAAAAPAAAAGGGEQ